MEEVRERSAVLYAIFDIEKDKVVAMELRAIA